MNDLAVVIASRGRPAECDAAWRSVVAHLPEAQLIVVEQQSGGERYPVGDDFPGTWIRQTGRGVSRARNRGLAEVACGDVLFLDDDAQVVSTLTELVEAHRSSGASATAGRVRYCPSRNMTRGDEPTRLTPTTVGRCFIEFSTIFRTDALLDVGGFDERLGVGSDFGAEEGSAVLARLAASHDAPLRYEPVVMCEHPDVDAPPSAKARSYGQGVGALIPLYPTSAWIWRYVAFTTVRTTLGSLVFLVRGDTSSARPRCHRLRGVAEGVALGLRYRWRTRPERRRVRDV